MRLQRLETDPSDRVLQGSVFLMKDADTMGPAPEQYRFYPYELRMTYGKSESEEAAARYITLCQRYGKGWVGLDYNAFCRMVAEELEVDHRMSGKFSLILMELTRFGASLQDAINAVIAVGIHDLKDKGFVRVERDADEAGEFDVIFPTREFFAPIQRHVLTPV